MLAAGTGLATGALLLAGCTGEADAPGPAPTTPPPPDPLLAELSDESRLVATYDAAIARHPGLRARLAGLREDHLRHAQALAAVLGLPAPGGTPDAGGTAGPGRTGPGGTGPGGVPTAAATPVPATPAAALAALRAAERAATSARGTAALTAAAARASLLAAISASEASHLVVLA